MCIMYGVWMLVLYLVREGDGPAELVSWLVG